MDFIKANILSLYGLTLYFVWWLYLLFDFGKKEYDNNFAGAVAVEAIAELTIIIILIYLIGFLIAAFRTRKWKKYMIFITLILVPVLFTIIFFGLF